MSTKGWKRLNAAPVPRAPFTVAIDPRPLIPTHVSTDDVYLPSIKRRVAFASPNATFLPGASTKNVFLVAAPVPANPLFRHVYFCLLHFITISDQLPRPLGNRHSKRLSDGRGRSPLLRVRPTRMHIYSSASFRAKDERNGYSFTLITRMNISTR